MVLVADDHADTAKLVAMMLRRSGFDAQAVFGGQGVIDLLKTTTPEVIVLDIHMPGVDGMQVLLTMLGDERTRSIPVIIYSADHDPLVERQAKRLGARNYLIKGAVRFDVIVGEVARYVSRPEMG